MATGNNNQMDMSGGPLLRGVRRRIKPWWAAAALLVVVGLWWFMRGEDTEETDQPLLATVEIGSIENTIASAGTLKPSAFVDVGAQVSGQLQKLYVEVGDMVEQGQLLVEIDARVQESRVEASRASIAAQEAQLDARRASLELARSNAERQERLMAENATSQLEYDNAVNNLAAAESGLIQLQKQIEQSRASLTTEETQLEFTKIFAPATGTIVSIEMIEGRTLNAAQMAPNILRIADLTSMRVEADISEADIGDLRPGMQVYFTTLGGGNRRWYGTLQQILPTPEVLNNVVLYTGLFEVENADGALLSEMTAQVYFVTASAENVLTVPLGALRFPEADELPGGFAVAQGSPAGVAPPEGFRPPEGFTPPAGGFGGGGRPRGGFAANTPNASPRPAIATVVSAEGTQEDRQVMVGVTSRIDAEIVSGLRAGEQVIAGIVQTAVDEEEGNQNRGPAIRFGGGRPF